MVQGMFESHTSASLEDFEHHDRPSPVLRYPSERSGFVREDSSEPGADSASSEGPWDSAQPGWRGNGASAIAGSGWYRHQPYLHSPDRHSGSARSSRSREGSHGLDDPTLVPANIPLPRGSLSPAKESPMRDSPARAFLTKGTSTSPIKKEPGEEVRSASPEHEPEHTEFGQDFEDDKTPAPSGGLGNYIRFAIRAEVQQRTAPLEMAVSWISTNSRRFPSSLVSLAFVGLAYIVFALLTKTPADAPAPDMIKLAGLARSVEPLMYYSERGVQYNTELQETGVAIWDLGESVRVANLTAGPTICRELDELGESLSGLSEHLQAYLSSVDGDVDNVLLTMEWARRELAALAARAPSPFASAVANAHSALNALGWLEQAGTGMPTAAGKTVMNLLGRTPAQRTRAALQRTFDEFAGVLEASLDAQLTRAAGLFVLFKRVDAQFRNLQRLTVREMGEQERQEDELLSSLWRRVVGAGAHRLRKFERNRAILHAVRGRTTANKNLLVDHEAKLKALKESLEMLRRRLVGPLLRGAAGSSIAPLEDHIKGLDESHAYLRAVRQQQKDRVLDQIYRAGSRAVNLEIDGHR